MLRVYLALLYESLLILAMAALVTTLYLWSTDGGTQTNVKRLGLQLTIWCFIGAYFMLCWVRSGQTLASQTWRLRVVNAQGNLLTIKQALKRYALASTLCLPAGLTFWWALLDAEHLFLHDRILGSRIQATHRRTDEPAG